MDNQNGYPIDFETPERLGTRLYVIARSYVHNSVEAEAIVSKVVSSYYTFTMRHGPDHFDESADAYLIGMLMNALKRLKKERESFLPYDPMEDYPLEDVKEISRLPEKELERIFTNDPLNLSILKHYLAGKNYKEIADILETSESAIKMRFSRTIKPRLKIYLNT